MFLKQTIHKPLIILTLLHWSMQLFSQTADTIYVYETIYITDTVWVETPDERDTIRIEPLESISNATLILDTIQENASLIYFSEGKSATIPINHIYVNRNQLKETKMKKAGFFTLMFLAFQSISFAQPEFSVKAGISQFWVRPFTNYTSGPTIGDHQGFELKGPLKNSNFSFSVGYELHSFGKKYILDILSSDLNNTEQIISVQESHRSIPFLIYYRYKHLEAFVGCEYRHVKLGYQYLTPDMFFSSGFRSELALTTGIEYSINKRLSLFGKLYLGDAFVKNKINNNSILATNGTNLDISLKYYFNRNREFKMKEKRVNSPRYF